MISGNEFIPRVERLYGEMDAAYGEVAARAGFSCEGCDGEKCCTVDLELHTYVEMHHLRSGFSRLGVSDQVEILARCETTLKARADDPLGDAYRNAVCVLNFDGLCRLYEYRPMICRLAGIPHFIEKPDGRTVTRGGCSRYETEIMPAHPDLRIDRTELYREMAAIEIDVVHATGGRTMPRTVAETIAAEHPEELLP